MAAPALAPSVFESYQGLRRLLDELFQFNQVDLDFGIYRIMNQKRAEIARFLDDDLLPQVRSTLADFRAGERDALQAELDKLRVSLQAAGVPPESAPRYRELREQLATVSAGAELENEVYSDLYTFFRRYYKEGDFISLRRYKGGVYAIPYEGEEVKLHWANADQYYVKTTEDFQDYRFSLPDGRHVHFRIVAAETERDNNKAGDEERRFALCEEEPVAEIEGEFHIRFEYRPSKEKQKDLNARAVETLLALPTLREWRDALVTPQPTASNGSRSLLEKHLTDYTAKNTFDYFIHKDLGGFLRREIDFFLKNEVAHLDDLDTPDERRAEQYLARLRAIKRIGHKIIDFLAQLEDFQKRLFLKKKFVVATEYCVTINHVPAALHDLIVANESQWDEWERLFAISELPDTGDRAAVLRNNPYLVLDTCFFGASFKETLLESIEDIDAEIDGLLINSENFQAISLLQKRFLSQVGCIYLDPPYNSKTSEILYKNNYKHSSWLSLIADRLALSRSMMNDDAVLVIAIDENEQERLGMMLEQEFQDGNKTCITVVHNPRGIQGGGFSYTHEYAYFVSPKNLSLPKRRLEAEKEKPLMKTGSVSMRHEGRNMFYPIYIRNGRVTRIGGVPNDDFHPGMGQRITPDGDVETWPVDSEGNERKWRYKGDSLHSIIDQVSARPGRDGRLAVYLGKNEESFRTVWTGAEYNAAEYGSTLLRNMVDGKFSFPKSLNTVLDCIRIGLEKNDGVVLDYFAGSGTTGHAVIDLNREDEGRRKYILVEMGEYFDSILKPRILKTIYSKDWRDGKPVSREGSSHFLKYQVLESYEDALNNLDLRERPEAQQRLLEQSSAAREDYMLSYCLDIETQGSASLLDLERFEAPFDYQLTVTQGGESRSVTVDLPETFNYLLGLRVQRARTHDRFYTVEGTDPEGKHILVVWRWLKEPGADNEALEPFFAAQGYADRPAEEAFDRVYVNGDNTLLNLRPEGASWQVLLIEDEFKRLMFADAGEGGF